MLTAIGIADVNNLSANLNKFSQLRFAKTGGFVEGDNSFER